MDAPNVGRSKMKLRFKYFALLFERDQPKKEQRKEPEENDSDI